MDLGAPGTNSEGEFRAEKQLSIESLTLEQAGLQPLPLSPCLLMGILPPGGKTGCFRENEKSPRKNLPDSNN